MNSMNSMNSIINNNRKKTITNINSINSSMNSKIQMIISKLDSFNSIQLLILLLMLTLKLNSKSTQSINQIYSIVLLSPCFRYYISDTLSLLLLSLLLLYYILLYYHMLLLLLLGFNLILLLPISLYSISIISWLYCMRSSSYSYRIVHQYINTIYNT